MLSDSRHMSTVPFEAQMFSVNFSTIKFSFMLNTYSGNVAELVQEGKYGL